MWSLHLSITFLVVSTMAVTSTHSMLSYYIIPNDSASCDLDVSINNITCLTLQHFAETINSTDYTQTDISLSFAPGKHVILGGVELNNTANIDIKGVMIEGLDKPQITCEIRRCFSVHNSSNIHVENIAFADCFSEDSDGGALFISRAESVNITQCSFTNNFVRKRGGAIRFQLIKSVHVLESQFFNNSAICYPFNIVILFGFTYCLDSCIASSGAISAAFINSFSIEKSMFENNTASCFSGAVGIAVSSTQLISNNFIGNSVGTDYPGSGGGLYFSSSDVEIFDCRFEQNIAAIGGGILSTSAIVNITNTSFILNTAWNTLTGGGAAFFSDSILTIDRCFFEKNVAHRGSAIILYSNTNDSSIVFQSTFIGNGNVNDTRGTIYLELTGEPSCTASCSNTSQLSPSGIESVVSIDSCIFKSNKGIHSGAIYATRGVLNITRSYFSKHFAHIVGAVSASFSYVYISENDFSNNEALTYGGFLLLSDGIAFSRYNTFTNNTGGSSGGAIQVFHSTLFSDNDIYTNNYATVSGGAISAVDHSNVFCTGCTFLKNAVLASGGAVFVSNGSFSSFESIFEANVVSSRGGALFLVRSTASIKNDLYKHNNAINGEGAAIFQTDNQIRLHNTTFLSNQADDRDQLYTIQLTNVRGNCSDLTFTRNVGSMYLFFTTLSFSGSSSFTDNTAIVGGALTTVQGSVFFEELAEVYIANNRASFGGGIFLSQSEFGIYTSEFTVNNNMASISGGGIYGYQSVINIQVNNTSEPVLLKNNSALEGGALNSIATTVNVFYGSVLFSENLANRGGAVALSEGSKIYIQKIKEEMFNEPNIKVTFANNSAEYGGALFVDDDSNAGVLCEQSTNNQAQSVSTEECFIQTLRLYYPNRFIFDQFNYMNIFFIFNTALKVGHDIYGGLLDRCQINAFSEVSNNFILVEELNGFDYLKIIAQFQIEINYYQVTTPPFFPRDLTDIITRNKIKGLITSDPVQFCFCRNELPDCSYQWPSVFIRKGESFMIKAVTVDQVENPVSGTVLANVLSEGTRLEVDQTIQVTNAACTELTYNVFSNIENVSFQLYPSGPCDASGISGKTLNITFLPCDCPNGLEPAPIENECRCECNSLVSTYVSSCQQDNDSVTIVRRIDTHWINYVYEENVSGFLLERCPYDYCIKEPLRLQFSIPDNAENQCAFNRTGIMCGECDQDLSLVFGSSRCLECSNNYLALLAVFAVAGILLVVFILLLNLTVAVGTIHGLILYSNIVAANSAVFLPSETALRFFVSWVNLDIGIETCFYNGMDSHAKVLLQLVFPIYIVTLSVLIIILSNHWSWFSTIIGGRKNPVATLCTLFLLSYSKLLRMTIASLQYTTLHYPDGSSSILWLYNTNIQYLAVSRTPFFISSILIIFLGTIYTVLLFFGQWIRRIEALKCFQNSKYNAFIDAYQAPFIGKHRYWIGVLLLTRIIHHLLSSLVDESAHLFIVTCITCGLIILKFILTEVYQKWLIGFVETTFLINLLLFAASTYYVSTANGNQVAAANTSIAIAFITFFGIVVYHTHEYLLRNISSYTKLISSGKNHLQPSWQKIRSLRSSTLQKNTGKDDTQNKISPLRMSSLREPFLDIIAPVSDQDYAQHSKSIHTKSSKSPKPDSAKPTSTTVEIGQSQI